MSKSGVYAGHIFSEAFHSVSVQSLLKVDLVFSHLYDAVQN